jgi:outer membrane protein OmpA-like peptidoglycan-associated protein
MQKKQAWFFIFAFIVLLLAGCSSHKTPIYYSDQCKILQFQYQLGQTLKSDGIQVVVVGDEAAIYLPVYRFFYTGSNHMKNQAKILSHIIAYINTYPVNNIQVKGYTDNTGDYTRNLALSRAQAQEIANYLWHHGLNARLISAEGLGCHNPYGLNWVEIFFRQPPPDNVFH